MSIYRNSNLAILLSGGVGSRIQTDMPKQYVRVSGFMMVTYALQTLIESDCIDGVYVVADESYRDEIVGDIADLFGDKGQEGKSDSCVKDDKIQKIRGFVDPGENRQLSILNALEKIREDIGKGDLVYDVVNDVDVDKNNKDKHINSSDVTVLVQDAARPMLSKKMIAQCYEALPGHDGVMPVLPMKDTVYMSRDGKSVSQLLDRSQIFAGQAPELFLYEKYYRANVALLPDEILKINGASEPAILAGMDIVMIPGDEKNYKVTTDEDMDRFRSDCEDIL